MYQPRIDLPADQDTGKLRPAAQDMRTQWPIAATYAPGNGPDFSSSHIHHVKGPDTTTTYVNVLEPVELGWALPPGGAESNP